MAKREISLTRALAEVKSTQGRIMKATDESAPFAVAVKKTGAPQRFDSQEEYKQKVSEQYQSVQDLIAKMNRIKAAIIKRNSEVTVTIGEENPVTMTIAEAIWKKDAIDYDKYLLRKLRTDYRQALHKKEQMDRDFEEQLARKENETKNAKGENKDLMNFIEKEKDLYRQKYEPMVVHLEELDEKIEKLDKAIEDFETNVDFVLSEVNAKTTIEIED